MRCRLSGVDKLWELALEGLLGHTMTHESYVKTFTSKTFCQRCLLHSMFLTSNIKDFASKLHRTRKKSKPFRIRFVKVERLFTLAFVDESQHPPCAVENDPYIKSQLASRS